MTPLIVTAVALEHREITLRRLMVENVVLREVFDRVGRSHCVERTRHPCTGIRRPHLRMARRALIGTGVARLRRAGTAQQNHESHDAHYGYPAERTWR